MQTKLRTMASSIYFMKNKMYFIKHATQSANCKIFTYDLQL